MSNRFITVHVLTTLPLHNLNRDGNGLPKSALDGGVQRARLSSQSIKRAARLALRRDGYGNSLRTRLGAYEVSRRVVEQARAQGVQVDIEAVVDAALLAIRSLYVSRDKLGKGAKQRRQEIIELLTTTGVLDGTASDDPLADAAAAIADKPSAGNEEGEAADTITFYAIGELDALAAAILDASVQGEPMPVEFIRDSSSASLDIAAFGRMFASRSELSTLGAVAVGHSETVHQMQLISDYFTAVDDVDGGSGAGHMGNAYYTTGTYYRTFTIDVEQLARSWSAFHGQDADAALTSMVRALVLALPSGKLGPTNASVLPSLVLAETQSFRVAYGFENPIQAGPTGGYEAGAIAELARQRAQALNFAPELFGPAAVVGATGDSDFSGARACANLDDLVAFVVSQVREGSGETA